jgi:hypothetical protein
MYGIFIKSGTSQIDKILNTLLGFNFNIACIEFSKFLIFSDIFITEIFGNATNSRSGVKVLNKLIKVFRLMWVLKSVRKCLIFPEI